jgi:hypothetical protein
MYLLNTMTWFDSLRDETCQDIIILNLKSEYFSLESVLSMKMASDSSKIPCTKQFCGTDVHRNVHVLSALCRNVTII